MDGLVLLVILGAVAVVVLGPIGFFLAIGQGRRLTALEREIARLRLELQSKAAVTAAAAPAELAPKSQAPEAGPDEAPARRAPAPTPEPVAASTLAEPAAPQPGEPAPPPEEPTRAPAPPSPAPAARPSLEEALGARWTVWVGGAALALGAVLLVRFTIEQGWFGPGARVVLGLAVSAALVAAGEFLRRRDAAVSPDAAEAAKGAYIPGALTAAGVTGGFGAIYAAHALYHFIGAGPAFLALGAVALAAIAAALLHGPGLAGLGLVGALATPLLVSSQEPNPWPVVLYLAVVAAAAYALARLRRWLWLALAAAVGAALWTLLLDATSSGATVDAAQACLVVQTALAALAFAILPYRGQRDEAAEVDRTASLVLAGFALIAVVLLWSAPAPEAVRAAWVVAASSTAMLALAGVLAPPAAAASVAAGAIVAIALWLWPAAPAASEALAPRSERSGAETLGAFDPSWTPPAEVSAFVAFAALAALSVAALAAWRLRSGERLKAPIAAIYAAAATLTPLAAVAVADMRLAQGASSGRMALVAALIGAAFVAAARLFRDGLPETAPPAARVGLGAFAAGAVAALASGLVFALAGGSLTVSLALAALASAFVADRLALPALRWSAAALGLAVAARLAWDPRVVGAALSPTPILNWLLIGYGVPAAAFALAGRLLSRRADDLPARVADALAVLFAAFLTVFEIRHALNGGDPFAPASGLVEQGLFSVSAFGFGFVLTRLDAARANVVFRWASLAAGALGLAVAIVGLLLVENPFLTGEPVAGGLFVNALLIGYLAPAALAVLLFASAKASRPVWYWAGAGLVAAALGVAYLILETRVLFHGSAIGWREGFTAGEAGVQVAILVACALALLPRFGAAAASALAAAAFAGAALGPGLFANPYWTGDPVGGGAAFNALMLGYLAPAGLFAALAVAARGRAPRLAKLSGGAAILLAFGYATLETRRLFHGPAIGVGQPTSDAEFTSYSAVWLVLGLALLAWGVVRRSKEARLASAFFVVAATLKAFVFDLAGLEGGWRALSFLGLGAALIAIGLVYQRLVLAKPPASLRGPDAEGPQA